MDFRSLPAIDPDMSVDLDETRVFEMRDLVSSDIRIHRGSQVRSRNIIQFIVLARPRTAGQRLPGQTTPWTVPEPQEFHDLVNRTECYMIAKTPACFRIQKWANLWGKVGLLGLSAKNADHLEEFRRIIESLGTNDLIFTIFPREGLDKKGSVSILLRETFRSYEPTCLPEALLLRNRGLRGSLRVTHIKTYHEDDRSRGGQSKKDWRLILLQGCAEFMTSLEAYSEDAQFILGSGHIFIRGGVRRPRALPDREQPGRGQRPALPAPRGTRGNDNNNNSPHFNKHTSSYANATRGTFGRANGGENSGGRNPSVRPSDHGGQTAGPSYRAGATSRSGP